MDIDPMAPEAGAGEAAPPADGETVTISRAELEALRARVEGRGPDATNPPAEAEKPPGRSDAVSRNREARFEQQLAERDRRVAELERACKAAVRDRELATALAGKPLVAGAASQLLKLWRDDFEAYDDDGAFKVAARDGQAVAPIVDARLASSEYAHFCLPSSRGGTGSRDASRPSTGATRPAPSRTLGESALKKWHAAEAARPQDNLMKPIGLGRRRSGH